MSDEKSIAPRSWKDMKEPMSLEDYAAQRMREQADQPVGDAKGIIDYTIRGGAANNTGWDPTSPEATGWHGRQGLLSNYRSGEDPIYSPGHHYTHTEKICDGRTGNCDLSRTNAEALVVPGATSTASIREGGKYTARAFDIPGDVITTRTGPHPSAIRPYRTSIPSAERSPDNSPKHRMAASMRPRSAKVGRPRYWSTSRTAFLVPAFSRVKIAWAPE